MGKAEEKRGFSDRWPIGKRTRILAKLRAVKRSEREGAEVENEVEGVVTQERQGPLEYA